MSDGYTMKEIVNELRQSQTSNAEMLTKILTSAKGVEEHLERLNSKVATHEKQLNTLGDWKTRMVAYGTAIMVAATFIFNKIL